MLQRYNEELKPLSARWSNDAKEKTERVLNRRSGSERQNNASRGERNNGLNLSRD
jgi:hypothetical protein